MNVKFRLEWVQENMFNGTMDMEDILLYRKEAEIQGKSKEYLSALSDLADALQESKEEYQNQKKSNLDKLDKRRSNSVSTGTVMLYFYERKLDNSISKTTYIAVEKRNSYEVKNCWRSRLSKRFDINKHVDVMNYAMWSDSENDELMEELLARY